MRRGRPCPPRDRPVVRRAPRRGATAAISSSYFSRNGRPTVLLRDVATAVAAHPFPQLGVVQQQPQALDELVPVGVVQTRVAALAVVRQHVAASVRQHRRARRERFQHVQRDVLLGGGGQHDGGGGERLQPVALRQRAGGADERFVGDFHQLDAHQRQLGISVLRGVAAEVLDQLLAAASRTDPGAAEGERSEQALAPPEAGAAPAAVPERARRLRVVVELVFRRVRLRRVQIGRQVDAAPDHVLDLCPVREAAAQNAALDRVRVGDGGRPGEHFLAEIESERRMLGHRRHQDAPPRGGAQAQDGRRVEAREEDQRVIAPVLLLQVLDERRTPRPMLPQPGFFVLRRVRRAEHPLRGRAERRGVAGLRVGEAPHGHAADAVGARGVGVGPRRVVARARGQHLHRVGRRQALGDQPAVELRPAGDLGAVARGYAGKSHGSYALPAGARRFPSGSTGPRPARSSTALAGGHWRRRRPSQPGSGSMVRPDAADPSS